MFVLLVAWIIVPRTRMFCPRGEYIMTQDLTLAREEVMG